MPFDSGERRSSKANQAQVGAAGTPPPDQQGHLSCPRCDSPNTKFCYYNNYNFSQPRHFCKTCCRYWTHGGTLRDIPVGGGSRKSAKRYRTTAISTTGSATYPPDNCHMIANSTPVFVHHGEPIPFAAGEAKPTLNMFGSFTSLLNAPGHEGPITLGGYGLGLGSGFEDAGFGLGRPLWPYTGVEDGGGNPAVIGNTWQVESGDGAFGGGDCFSWPGLAISTHGNAMK